MENGRLNSILKYLVSSILLHFRNRFSPTTLTIISSFDLEPPPPPSRPLPARTGKHVPATQQRGESYEREERESHYRCLSCRKGGRGGKGPNSDVSKNSGPLPIYFSIYGYDNKHHFFVKLNCEIN